MTDITTLPPQAIPDQLQGRNKLTSAQADAATLQQPATAKASRSKRTGTAAATKKPGEPASKEKRQTKASEVEALLTRKSGATLAQMCEVTGWQAHTCRAFMTGLRKKGRELIRETGKGGKSIYRLAATYARAKAD